jgi:hypothetical protein
MLSYALCTPVQGKEVVMHIEKYREISKNDHSAAKKTENVEREKRDKETKVLNRSQITVILCSNMPCSASQNPARHRENSRNIQILAANICQALHVAI